MLTQLKGERPHNSQQPRYTGLLSQGQQPFTTPDESMFKHELDTRTYDTFGYQSVPKGYAKKVEVYVTSTMHQDCTWLHISYMEEVKPSSVYEACRQALELYPDTKVSMVKF